LICDTEELDTPRMIQFGRILSFQRLVLQQNNRSLNHGFCCLCRRSLVTTVQSCKQNSQLSEDIKPDAGAITTGQKGEHNLLSIVSIKSTYSGSYGTSSSVRTTGTHRFIFTLYSNK